MNSLLSNLKGTEIHATFNPNSFERDYQARIVSWLIQDSLFISKISNDFRLWNAKK